MNDLVRTVCKLLHHVLSNNGCQDRVTADRTIRGRFPVDIEEPLKFELKFEFPVPLPKFDEMPNLNLYYM